MNNRLNIKLMSYRLSIALERDCGFNMQDLQEYILIQRISEERKKSIMPDFDNIRAISR